jgi:hypothetical protein
MELGEPDATGRRRPVPVPDSDFVIDADCVIMAIGTSPNPLIKSTTGIAWSKTETKFLLPQEFKGKGAYSIIVEPTKDKTVDPADKRDFIWVIFGGNGTKNEVWRGRLNRLGFEIQ